MRPLRRHMYFDLGQFYGFTLLIASSIVSGSLSRPKGQNELSSVGTAFNLELSKSRF